MRNLQGWEWLVLLVIVLLLFGARRLPDLARSLGKSMRILKTEVKDLHADEPSRPTEPPTAEPPPPLATAPGLPTTGTATAVGTDPDVARSAPLTTSTPTDDDGERPT